MMVDSILGADGILRTPVEHYDTLKDVEQDPYGARLSIQQQADEITRLRAQLAAAEADKLAAITKAVNEKLERALNSILFEAEAYREMGFLDAAQSLNMIAGDIFEMTEPE